MKKDFKISDAGMEKRILELLRQKPPVNQESRALQEMLRSLHLIDRAGFNVVEMRLLNTAFKELRHALWIFKKYHESPKAAVFGSARTHADHPDYLMAKRFGRELVKRKWMVITGGASGIMEAAMVGAGARQSFGLNICLPFEQEANEVIQGNAKLMYFRYFFTRKLMFLKESAATVLFPGGFGTFDEGFESLTLIQTGKAKPRPVVLIDSPGSDYWKKFLETLRYIMEEQGMITRGDLSLMRHYHDPVEAADEIVRFYKNYHSSRFYGDHYLIRLKKTLSAAALRSVNAEFKDLVTRDRFRILKGTKEDDESDPKLTRLVFAFNRSSYHRLRELIDFLNARA